MACALVAGGRHQLLAYTGRSDSPAHLRCWGESARPAADLEEVLADPAIDAVIVAGSPANRPAQLRRALQSERHVLCVHPADHTPDTAYEAGMIQGDTRRVLLPLLPDALHPGIVRLAELIRQPDGPVGPLRLLDVERATAGEFLLDSDDIELKPALPGWDVVRALGGEVAEVSALAPGEDLRPGQALLLSGRFEQGGVFQASFLPNVTEPRVRLTATGERGRVELLFPVGWQGPAFLTWRDASGEWREEAWDAWDPWPLLGEIFEAAVTGSPHSLTWNTAIRSLELDDAARRSVTRRRASALEYPEATEEVGFKGTMTLVGCGLLWLSLLLLILSRWVPWLGWLVVPVIGVFLLLQMLRWAVPRTGPRPPGE
jgi:predicted dehydrogenase